MWVLISAKQCVSVSDWVVFVREMGRSVGRLSGAGLIFVARCGLDGDVYRLDYIGCAMVGWPFRAPFLFLVCLVGV